jgi:hypothetical protein
MTALAWRRDDRGLLPTPPQRDTTTSMRNIPGAPPGPIATSMTVITPARTGSARPAPQLVTFPPLRPDLPG